MSQIVFRNFSLLDPRWDEARGGYEILVERGTIKEVSAKQIKASDARTRPTRRRLPYLDAMMAAARASSMRR